MTVEHISWPYMCPSLNLFNNPMKLSVFLFSSPIRGNRGTKRLSRSHRHSGQVTQSLRTGHLTPESCLQLCMVLSRNMFKKQKGSQCGCGMRGLGRGRTMWGRAEVGAKPGEFWGANKKFGFYPNYTGKPLEILKQGNDITNLTSHFLNFFDFCFWKDGVEVLFFPISKTENPEHYRYSKHWKTLKGREKKTDLLGNSGSEKWQRWVLWGFFCLLYLGLVLSQQDMQIEKKIPNKVFLSSHRIRKGAA